MSRKTRKLIWSVPVMAVLAIAGALAMFAAQGPAGVSADSLPAAPGNLEVATADGDAGRTMLVLTWGAAADATGYRIDISDQGAVWETMMMDTGSTATTYTDDTLTASDTRWYRVFAVNSHGVGPVSNAASGTTDDKVNPGSVMNLRAVYNPKNPYNHIDLSWDPPADNGGEMIVGYEIQNHVGGDWVAIGGSTTSQATVTTKTTVTDDAETGGEPQLNPGDSRLYRVRAINGASALADTAVGDDIAISAAGDTSKEWVTVTGKTKEASNPGQVTGLTAVNTGAQQISLYWYAPENTGGVDISDYLIQARREGKKFPSIPTDAQLTTTASAAVTLGSTANPDNMNRFIDVPGPGVAQVTFDGIENTLDTNNDDTADAQERWYFRVFALTSDQNDKIRRSQSPSNVASDMAAAREIDHDSNAATAIVDPLASPVITPTGSNGNSGDDAEKQRIDLGLALNAAIVTNNGLADSETIVQIAYRIDYSEDDGATWKLLERDTRFTGFSPTKPYADDKGLDFDEQRHYRVFAIGKDPYTDVGPPCCATIPEGMTAASAAPKKPTGVTASSPSLRSIMASWTAPEDNGGQDIVKYYYQYVLDDEDGVPEAEDFTTDNTNVATVATDVSSDSTDDAATTALIELTAANQLEMEEVYVFRVAAVNKDAAGADRPTLANINAAVADGGPNWSDGVIFNTSEAAKPNAVEGLTSELATDASGDTRGVNLLWNKPSGPAPTGYEVEVQDGDGDWVSPQGGGDVQASITSFTDSEEPEEGEMRKYRVRASNGVGDGPWTEVYYPRDPADDHTHAPAVLMAPTNVMASSTTARELTLTWEGGENADYYILVAVDMTAYAAGNLQYETASAMSGDSTGTVSNLTSGTPYLGIVFAVKGTGADAELMSGLAVNGAVSAQ